MTDATTDDRRVAIVTGAAGALGSAMSERFVRDGIRVVVADVALEPARALAARLDPSGASALPVAVDVADYATVEAMVQAVLAWSGRIDIMVNNAGGTAATGPVVDVTDEDWDLNMKWNLYSTFYGTRRALKHMIPQQWGRIINMSSVEGKHGKPMLSGYVTAKHAINGLTKVAAKEVGTQGITVNSICPGLVITEIVRENGPRTAESMGLTFEGMVDLFAEESALKRPNTVEEVAAMAVLLASDAGAGITGAMLSVDGGTAAY